jgi:hypothetical protein
VQEVDVLATLEQVVPEHWEWVPPTTGCVQTDEGVPGLRQVSVVQIFPSLQALSEVQRPQDWLCF